MEGMKRPEAIVLPDSSLIPPGSLIAPPPNQFTHEVTTAQPFYFAYGAGGGAPSGEFAPGTRVVLMVHDGGAMCRVVDGAGLYVDTAFAGLRRL